MKILIDNGHGVTTKGKRSPDGSLLEWAWTREIARHVVAKLNELGYDSSLLVPEDDDVSVTERCRRVNSICRALGCENVVLVSIHINACGDGSSWFKAQGFEVYVSLNASDKSKDLARTFTTYSSLKHLEGNRCIPGEKYWSKNLGICRDTLCAAVLTENLFMDNKEDMSYLLSDAGKNDIVNLHVESIVNYVERH